MIDTTVPVNARDLFSVRVCNMELSSTGKRVKALFELTSITTKATKPVEITYESPDPISKDDCESDLQTQILETWCGAMDSSDGYNDVNLVTNVTWSQVKDWAIFELSKPSPCQTLTI